MTWDRRSLELVSATLAVVHPEDWPFVARGMGIRSPAPGCLRMASDSSPSDSSYDPESDTVIVRNPFAGCASTSDGRRKYGGFLEMDAGLAARILLLASSH